MAFRSAFVALFVTLACSSSDHVGGPHGDAGARTDDALGGRGVTGGAGTGLATPDGAQAAGASGSGASGSGASGSVTGGSATTPVAEQGASGGGAAALGGGGAAGGAVLGEQPRCAPAETAQSRMVAAAALDGLFVEKRVLAIDEYWGEPYLQHNPIAKSGVAAFKSIMSSVVTSNGFSYERLRLLADCDLAVVQGKYASTGVIFDMFRIKDGKLVEHWDSDSNQASDASGPTPDTSSEQSAQNRERALSLLERVLIQGERAAAAELLAPTFLDHRGNGTGPESFLQQLTSSQALYTRVHHVIADGDFVFTLSEGKLGGVPYGFYDLFRLDAGRIVEHWDSRRAVPASTSSGLGIF